MRVVREAIGPDIKLMCDINQRWRPEQAIDIGSRAEDVDGFLAAWYASSDYQPRIRVYDANTLSIETVMQQAVVEGATTIHVTAGGSQPIHVALLSIDGRRVFAKLDHPPGEEEAPEVVLAGQKVKLLVKDDGDHYFQLDRGRSLNVGRLVERVRRRIGRGAEEPEPGEE